MNPGIESLLGFAVVVITAAALIVLSWKKIRTRFPPIFRKIPAIAKLRRAIGLSVEDGSRIHVTLGNSDLNQSDCTSGLSALSTLHRLGQLTSTSDQPPLATSGNGGLSILSKDVLRATSVETNTRELYDPDHGQMTGITPFSYAMGAMNLMNDPDIKANILLGEFGPEAGFFSVGSEENGHFTLASSSRIVAQSVFFATTRDVLIGEELYAIPAYLAYTPVHIASLRVQDILRILLGIFLVSGAILRVLGLV